MKFDTFASILYGAMGSKENNGLFTQELFYNIVECTENNPLDSVTTDSFHKYFNGSRSISGIAKKIKRYVDMENFAAYLSSNFSDAMAVDLVTKLSEHGITIDLHNFDDEVAGLFNSIILEAVTPERVGVSQEIIRYLNSLQSRYNKIKTLLYYSEPQPFYEFYVANDVYSSKNKRLNAEKMLLGSSRKFTVITGTGGIGKSMLMKHLTLQLAENYTKYKKIPILIQLKEYRQSAMSLKDIIHKSIKISGLEEKLNAGNCVVLLDAMDEIRSSEIKNFEKELCEFVELYPDNTYIMSSRPISSFIALNRFEVYRLAPFTKAQALKLVKKLKYRPETPELKENFYMEVDSTLYETHKDFAENPLLLTIMLMTYERYARIPYKRHVFYKYAFNTLVEKHDATKVGFDRVFKTKMTPEEFSTVLEEFCGRTYFDEKYELTEDEFNMYFDKLKCIRRIGKSFSCRDLIKDLTMNLCILTHDNGKYCFIHRSFQEYFCALRLSKAYDSDFKTIQAFFEDSTKNVSADYTFDMMYDLASEKIEKFIFIPFLTDMFEKCKHPEGGMEEYWNFLEIIYPEMYCSNGDVLVDYENTPSSFIYESLIRLKGIDRRYITNLPESKDHIFERYVCVKNNSVTTVVEADKINEVNQHLYNSIENCGCNMRFCPKNIRNTDSELRKAIESRNFPFYLEFNEIKNIFTDMKQQERVKEAESYSSVFD